MENPAKISNPSNSDGVVLVHSKDRSPVLTSQVAASSSFVVPSTLDGFDSRIPLFNVRQSGLLKAEPDSGVIRESGFLFLPSEVVGVRSDERCEQKELRPASRIHGSTIPSNSRRWLCASSISAVPGMFRGSIKRSALQVTTSFIGLSLMLLTQTSMCFAEVPVSFSYSNIIRAIYGEAEAE